jgi:mannan endo-1,4-beta-mannosidase
LDFYDAGTGYSTTKYSIIVKAAKGKPIAIGECQKLPTPTELSTQKKWSFFMSWSELTFSHNTTDEINTLYKGQSVGTLDKMPGW